MEDNKRNILNGQINKIQDVIDWLTINFNLLDVVDGVIFMEIVKENFKNCFQSKYGKYRYTEYFFKYRYKRHFMG
jgi:hypothetical protein